MGCRANGTLSGKLTVDSAEAAAMRVQVATANQTSGRQRGDSSCPWGNCKNTSTGTRTVRSIGQTANQAAQSPPGSDPGAVTSAYWAYWLPAWVTATTRPKAPHSQPIGLPGWRAAIRAPTVAKVSDIGTRASSSWLPGQPALLRESSHAARASSPMVRPHSDQASRTAACGVTDPPRGGDPPAAVTARPSQPRQPACRHPLLRVPGALSAPCCRLLAACDSFHPDRPEIV